MKEHGLTFRYFKGDKWTRMYDPAIPLGATVQVVKFYPRRRVVIDYQGMKHSTMLWCLGKL